MDEADIFCVDSQRCPTIAMTCLRYNLMIFRHMYHWKIVWEILTMQRHQPYSQIMLQEVLIFLKLLLNWTELFKAILESFYFSLYGLKQTVLSQNFMHVQNFMLKKQPLFINRSIGVWKKSAPQKVCSMTKTYFYWAYQIYKRLDLSCPRVHAWNIQSPLRQRRLQWP